MSKRENKVQSILWEIFDHLRGRVKEYDVTLYLLVLHKLKALRPLIDSKSDLERKFNLIDYFNNCEEGQILSQAYDEFNYELSQLRPKDIKFISAKFDELLTDHSYDVLFERNLHTLVRNRGFEKGEQILPDEMSELIVSLADINGENKVYNPFAGLASFGIKRHHNSTYVGEEIQSKTRLLAMLRLLAHEKFDRAEVSLADSLGSTKQKNYFDRIISSVPFGLRISKKDYPKLNSRIVEEFFIKDAIENVQNSGKIIAHISNGFLSRGGSEKKLRENLLNCGLVEGVIQLPSSLMFNTKLSTSIIILSKERTEESPIVMLDASELYRQVSRTYKSLDYKTILSLYNEGSESDVLRLVKPEQVKKDNFNFTVSRYFVQDITSQFEGVKLNDILSRAAKTKVTEEDRGKVISISDLNDDMTGVFLDIDSIEEREIKLGCFSISEQSLLIARIGAGLKPTIFKDPSSDIFISNHIEAFKFDENVIDPGYLVFELRKEYVKKQIEKLQGGSSHLSISRSDFLNIKIELPSIDKQRKLLLNDIHDKTSKTIQTYSHDIVDIQIHHSEHYRFVKHSLKNELGELKLGLKTLHEFFSNKEIINMNSIVSERNEMSLNGYMQSLRDKVNECTSALKLLDSPYKITERSTYDIYELISRARERFLDNSFDFEDDFSSNEKPIYISFNENHFFEIFKNVVKNAIEHGFQGKTGNIIRVKVDKLEGSNTISLSISNNGHPFKEGVDTDFVKELGQTTKEDAHKSLVGLGVAHIQNLIQLYDGTLNVYCDPDKEFTVEYELQIPIRRGL